MHQLDITYHNTFNCLSLKIEDNSVYDDNLPVKNIILEIKPPGLFGYIPFYFANKKWKSITLNCSTLKLCCTEQPCKFSELPDGIYDIKYSIEPNLVTILEFSHMRVCKLMTIYIKLLGLFYSSKHMNTKTDNEKIELEFLKIKDTIDNSIYAVEELADNVLGLDFYEEASKRLNKINNGDFTNCCK